MHASVSDPSDNSECLGLVKHLGWAPSVSGPNFCFHSPSGCVWCEAGGRGGMERNMPAHQTALAGQTVEVRIRIEDELIVVELPHELLGAYLIG